LQWPYDTLSLTMDSLLLDKYGIIYYRMGVGKLLHVTNTRLDVAFAVGIVTCFTTAPWEAHLNAVVHVFQYLRGTYNLAIHYPKRGEIAPYGFSDSDYLGDINQRKSTLGYIMSIGTLPILWKSKLQNEVAQSSSKAEYRALVEMTKEAMWTQNLLEEIHFPITHPVTIFCDNQSCIKIVKNLVFQECMKFIEKSCYLVRDHIKNGRLYLEFVWSQQQTAAILTKPLSKVPFHEMCNQLGLTTWLHRQSSKHQPELQLRSISTSLVADWRGVLDIYTQYSPLLFHVA